MERIAAHCVRMGVLLLMHQPHRPLPDLRGKRLTRLPTGPFVSCHAPNLSKQGAPSNPEAIQYGLHDV